MRVPNTPLDQVPPTSIPPVVAEELLPGDEVFTSRGGWVQVGGGSWLEDTRTVYNLEVDDFHTYFVGESGAWVHNACKRGLWQVTKEATDKVLRHPRYGKFHRHKADGTWWTKDRGGHGGPWKVYERQGGDLVHKADADKYGTYITDKHKGPVGRIIPIKEMHAVDF